VVFLEKTGERVEKILGRLTRVIGIGKRPNSSIRYCVKKSKEKCNPCNPTNSNKKRYEPIPTTL
jgi:hypothetical protein